MTQPTPYTPTTDFSADEVANTGGRSTVRTAALDAELANIETTLDGVLVNLSLNQRDDGEIRDARVKLHTLSADVKALLAAGQGLPRGAWTTATGYALRDVVTQNTNTYICALVHTAGTFATDLAAGKWLLLALGTAVAASGVPFTPTATISASNVQAALEEMDAEGRALSASLVAALALDLATAASAKGGALVAYLQSGAGATASTVQAKLRESVSITDFGAIPNDSGAGARAANYAALLAAIDALSHAQDSAFYSPAGRVHVPPGVWYMPAGGVNIERSVEILGSVANDLAPAVFSWPANSHGFIIHRYNTGSSGKGGDSTVLRGLTLRQEAGAGSSGYGIWMRARAYIENCSVDGFNSNGVHIVATQGGGGTVEGNANCWRLSTVRITSCGGHGLYLDGGDSNAGVAELVDCSSNAGFGILDSSFLGNTFVGCHTASNGTGAYSTDNPNAQSVFIGCYSEPGQPASNIVSPSIVIGGLHGAGVNGSCGFFFGGNGFTRLSNSPLQVYLGYDFSQTTPTSDANTLDRYKEGSYTPTVSGLTVVGTPTYTGSYSVIGNTVYLTIEVNVSGGTTASTVNATTFTLPPGYPPAAKDTAMVVDASVNNLGIGLIDTASGGLIKPPSWTARAASVVISGQYRIASA